VLLSLLSMCYGGGDCDGKVYVVVLIFIMICFVSKFAVF